MLNLSRTILLAFAFVLTQVGYALSEEANDHASHNHGSTSAPAASSAETTGDPYYLTYCPVTREPLGSMGDVIVHNYEGREVRFCCAGCIAGFEADADEFIAEVDTDIIADQLPRYPLTTCVVTGAELGAGAVDYVHNNRLVRFCCQGCVGEFQKDPASYIAKLDEATIAVQRESYPFDNCMVLTNKEVTETEDFIVAGRLFRVCCGGCKAAILADPAPWIAKLDAAPRR